MAADISTGERRTLGGRLTYDNEMILEIPGGCVFVVDSAAVMSGVRATDVGDLQPRHPVRRRKQEMRSPLEPPLVPPMAARSHRPATDVEAA